jgi:hypothetical protein
MRPLLFTAVMLVLAFIATLARPDRTPAAGTGPRLDIAAFQFEGQAQHYCGGDDIVWVVASRGLYNVSTERWYGQTDNGAFACLQDAERAGYRANIARQ